MFTGNGYKKGIHAWARSHTSCSYASFPVWRVKSRTIHNTLIQADHFDGELITFREWSVMDTDSSVAGHNVTRGQVFAPQPEENPP